MRQNGNIMPSLDLDIIERAVKQIEVLEDQRIESGIPNPLEYISVKGDVWSQHDWRVVGECGSGMCLAGWINTLDCGDWIGDTTFLVARPEEQHKWPTSISQYGAVVTACQRAINVTGITDPEAEYLFSGSRSLAEIKTWLEVKKAHPDGIVTDEEDYSWITSDTQAS